MLEGVGLTQADVQPVDDAAFLPIGTPDDAEALRAALAESIMRQAEARADLFTGSPEDRQAFADASAAIITPLLTGDLDAMIRAVLALGGRAPDSEEAWARLRSRWDYAQNRMQYTAVAPSRVVVADGYTESRGQATRVGDGLESIRIAARLGMRMTQGSRSVTYDRFPAISGWMDDPMRAALALAPVRMRLKTKTGKKTMFAAVGAVMVQEPESGRWQPAMILHSYDIAGAPTFHSEAQVQAYIREQMPAPLWIQ